MVVRPDVALGLHHDTVSSRVSVVRGHGVTCLMHRRCARALLPRQGLYVQVECARRGLPQHVTLLSVRWRCVRRSYCGKVACGRACATRL
jgi:hypothetical protein